MSKVIGTQIVVPYDSGRHVSITNGVVVDVTRSLTQPDELIFWVEGRLDDALKPIEVAEYLVVPTGMSVPDTLQHVFSVVVRNEKGWHIYSYDKDAPKVEEPREYAYNVIIHAVDPYVPFIKAQTTLDGVAALLSDILKLGVQSVGELERELLKTGKIAFKHPSDKYGLCRMEAEFIEPN